VEIKTDDSGSAKKIHDKSADHGPEGPEHSIQLSAVFCIRFHNYGSNPAGERAKDDPRNNTHLDEKRNSYK